MTFEPIAIVGRGCVLPGSLDPQALWQTIAEGKIHVGSPPERHWRVDMQHAISADPASRHPDSSWSDQGGYVTGFEAAFEPERFGLAAEDTQALDSVFRWSLHAAAQALVDTASLDDLKARTGLILGNLSYPTLSFSRLAEQHWLKAAFPAYQPHGEVDPRNRFMSGLPAAWVAKVLGLGGFSTALDAACASGLYAIKVACDRLQNREADLMLAGAVNASDPLFLHVGFCALKAMSQSGRSRPFHEHADGLVPAEGAAFVALKRLQDAVTQGDCIYAIIRGVGLSNDGRTGSFLSPSIAGQVRCMRAAYAMSGLTPEDVSLVECHATGTTVGDGAEIQSMTEVFGRDRALPIGSLKANLGHSITVSGVAGLLKVLGAMEDERLPVTPLDGPLHPELAQTGFEVVREARPWPAGERPRVAAVSSFGFGGNNAHLLVEDYRPDAEPVQVAVPQAPAEVMKVAIVGLGVRTPLSRDHRAFSAWLKGASVPDEEELDTVHFKTRQLAVPPLDLKQTLGQQLLMQAVAEEAVRDVPGLDPARTGVYIGMGADPEICRYGLRFRLLDYLQDLERQPGDAADPAWFNEAQEKIIPALQAAGVVGMMPNMPANRLNNHFRFEGTGYTVSNEELSGDTALKLAVEALQRGEIKTAVVGAVDFCRHPVHEEAARTVLETAHHHASDAAVALVLKPLTDARADGDTIIAVLDESNDESSQASDYTYGNTSPDTLTARLGHAHAASGLLHIAAAALMVQHKLAPPTAEATAQPRLPRRHGLQIAVENDSFTGARMTTVLTSPARQGDTPKPRSATAPLRIFPFAADTPEGLQEALETGAISREGACRLAVVCEDHELPRYLEHARRLLAEKQLDRPWTQDRVAFFPAPVSGALAFVYTGAASAYPGMGRDLLLHHPACLDAIASWLHNPHAAAAWIYDPDSPLRDLPFYQLCGSSFLCQVHTAFTMDLLGLQPDAALGLSSGETNAMFALGVWQDMDGLFAAIEASGLYPRACAGVFEAVQAHWQSTDPVEWENWRILEPVEVVQAALAGEERVYLTIISTPTDCVIGGDAAACRRVLDKVGRRRSQPLAHNLAVHCPAITPFEPAWRALHTRPVTPKPAIRFYSNYFGGVYTPTKDSVADALTGQAFQTLDFPKIVQGAWDDGVRIFLEHGPRNSLSQAITQILGDQPHLTVALDAVGASSLLQAYLAAAQLWCAGVSLDLDGLNPPPAEAPSEKTLAFPLRLPPVALPRLSTQAQKVTDAPLHTPARFMAPPPEIAPTEVSFQPPSDPAPGGLVPASLAVSTEPPLRLPPLVQAHARMLEGHLHFMQQLARAQHASAAFLDHMLQALLQDQPTVNVGAEAGTDDPRIEHEPMGQASLPPEADQKIPQGQTLPPEADQKTPHGPTFGRQELEIHASGRISSIFGPLFAQQDDYTVQVRMPEPPLLLCDRVTGIDAEPGSMGRGMLWTETDVKADSWYLHNGRMPSGIFIEAGQADLFLISWLGIDFHNKGARAYRLLGCELTFHGSLPSAGDTLVYDIHVDGHAQQGDVRLFFFHYDGHIDGERRISVRNGQAGFFTKEELASSSGVLWDPAEADYTPDPRLAPPAVECEKSQFSTDEVTAYTEGDIAACFGAAYRLAYTHTRTPRSQGGAQNLIQEVTHFDAKGGPAGRGYLRARTQVHPDDWYFDGHFKNDPCMPGTLMAEATLQTMSFYLTAMAYTLDKDGWRFEPVTEELYKFVCRGQATPASRELIYEVFVDEILLDPYPTLYAHVLCKVDGLNAFLCERLGLRLVPDYPLTSWPQLLTPHADPRPAAYLDDFCFDHASLLHCAWGDPALAFGPRYQRRDDTQRIARLPGPPYHFMTWIRRVEGAFGSLQAGAEVDAVYEIPPDAWYFQENGVSTMPYGVLMEIGLQPCGWLASYVLDEESRNTTLLFRNLDGIAVQHREVRPDDGVITTTARLTKVSTMGDLTLVSFTVRCLVGQEEVFAMETMFGFFPPEAMANQKGLPISEEEFALFDEAENIRIELTGHPAPYFHGDGPRLPASKLLMIDRITGYWPEGGRSRQGLIRAEKEVNVQDWFFKAHFYQDPVQPGSLGIEAMVQTLQVYLLHRYPDQCSPGCRFEPILIGEETEWHYRGQVTPDRQRITVDVEIHEAGTNEKGFYVLAEARLWSDSLKIYHAPRIGMQVIQPETRRPPKETSILKAQAAEILGLDPVCIEVDAVEERCLNLPLNRFVLRASASGSDVGVLDWPALQASWEKMSGVAHGFLHDLVAALMQKFVRRIILQDPSGFKRLIGKPALYLGNHQTAVESLFFLSAATALTNTPFKAIAKEEHRHTWIGRFHQLANRIFEGRNPSGILFFNREDQSHLLTVLKDFARQIHEKPCSLLVHVEGTRSIQCGNPVQKLSSVLLDLAIRHNISIVPVRFYGGLPREPVEKRLDLPLHFGQQDYYLGAAIAPQTLQALPYADRSAYVLDALNTLGPRLDQERPLPGDPTFAGRVQASMDRLNMESLGATLLEALASLSRVCKETQVIIEALTHPESRQDLGNQPLIQQIKALFYEGRGGSDLDGEGGESVSGG